MPQQPDASKQRRWLALIQLWQQSDLSVRAFCQRHHLRQAHFFAWRRTLRKRGLLLPPQPHPTNPSPQTPVFLQLSSQPEPADPSPIELVLAQRRLLRVRPGFDSQTLLQLLRLLEEPPC